MLHFESHCIMCSKCRYVHVFSMYVFAEKILVQIKNQLYNNVIGSVYISIESRINRKKPKSDGAFKAITIYFKKYWRKNIAYIFHKCTAENLLFLELCFSSCFQARVVSFLASASGRRGFYPQYSAVFELFLSFLKVNCKIINIHSMLEL